MAKPARSAKPRAYPSMRASDASPRATQARGSRLRVLLMVLAVCTALLLGLQVRRVWVRRSSASSSSSSLGAPLMDPARFSALLGLAPKDKAQEQEWDPDDPYRPLTTEEIKSFSMDDIQSMFDFIQSEVDFDKVPSESKEDAPQDRTTRFGRLRAAMGQPEEADAPPDDL